MARSILVRGAARVGSYSVWRRPPPAQPARITRSTWTSRMAASLSSFVPTSLHKHVERIKKLVKEGFYDGLTLSSRHRGLHGPDRRSQRRWHGRIEVSGLPAEFTPTPFKRGTVGAARSSNPNSANSQFFICLDDAPHLNGGYTVWGQVIDGMAIRRPDQEGNGRKRPGVRPR